MDENRNKCNRYQDYNMARIDIKITYLILYLLLSRRLVVRMADIKPIYVNHLLSEVEKLTLDDKITVKLSKKMYLTRESYLESHVYILIEGVVIMSLLGTNGENVNISYMNKPGIVTLFREEDEGLVNQPYDVKVDSNTATFYRVNRLTFWKLVNKDEILNQYVKMYYRQRINVNVERMEYMGSSKVDQVGEFLYRCIKLFGVKNNINGEILINHKITHQTIGDFCGIKSRSSVTRIMNKLVSQNLIEQKMRLILIKDVEYFEKYAR